RVPGRERSRGRENIPRHRPVDARRLLPLQCRRRPRVAGTAARRCGLCGRRSQRARRSVGAAQYGRDAASGADEIVMPTLFIGLLALVLVLWLLKSFARSDPRFLAKIVRTAGGTVALAGAAFLGARGELFAAVPLAVAGLGLLGWLPVETRNLFAAYLDRWYPRW